MIDVALLGTGGMMPLPNRFLTSLFCRLDGRFYMIDCGEGTQVTLKMLGWGFKNLDCICFTHYHADHISGLPGLLLTVGNAGREEALHLIGPPGLQAIVKSLLAIAPDLPFPIMFHEYPNRAGGLVIGEMTIDFLPLEHRIPCFAYRFERKRRGKFDLDRARALGVPMAVWSKLQKNDTASFDGKTYTSDMVLGPPRKGIRISYCTDTRPVPRLADFVRGSDLFVCEGLYGEEEKWEKAVAHHHMIYREAAAIAREAMVDELWLTHFSPSISDPKSQLSTATQIFPATIAGKDRMTKTIFFAEGEET